MVIFDLLGVVGNIVVCNLNYSNKMTSIALNFMPISMMSIVKY